MSHTKGPWRAVKSSKGYMIESDYLTVVHMPNMHGSAVVGHNEANARLIAAAPDMFTALKEIEKYMNGEDAHAEPLVRAALRKVRGES